MNRAKSSASRFNLLSLYLPAFILALGTSVAAPALPVFTKSFDISFGVASLAIIIHIVGGAAATVPTGYMIDRFGRRMITLAGPLITALSSFLVATATSFPELLVYRFLGGWASQMWTMARIAIIADTGLDTQRGRQITRMIGLESTGRLLGPALGGFAGAWNIRVPFVLHGILCLVAIVPSFKMLHETSPTGRDGQNGGATKDAGSAQKSLAGLFTYPFLLLFAVQLLVSLTRGPFHGGTLNLYAVYAYNIGPEVIGLMATITTAVGIPTVFLAGNLMDRWGRKATIVPGSFCMGAGMAVMGATAYLHSPFLTYAVVFVLTHTALSLTGGSMQTLGSDVAPPDARGRFLGIWRLISEIGTILGPAIFAILSEALGYTVSFSFVSVMGFGTAILVATRMRETLRK